MFFNHPISDLVSRIKNGYTAGRITISSPVSKLRERVLEILKKEGYIVSYSKVKEGKFEKFDISLKYHNQNPVLSEIEVVSKPGRRIYCDSSNIPLVKNGLGVTIISTSSGLVTDHEARAKNIGGEVLLKIF